MAGEYLDINIPRGRWTHGSITEKRTKNMQGQPIEPDKQQYEWGVAVPKDTPGLLDVFGAFMNHAKAGYSAHQHIVQRIDQWYNTLSGFSMKISDGDRPNEKGKYNENTRGCYVFWFSTFNEVTVCGPDNVTIDPSAVQRGDYVDMAASIAINTLTDKNAGMYLNGNIMRVLDYGDPISGSANPDEAFGSTAGVALGARPGTNPSGPPGGGVHGGQGAGGPGAGGPGAGAGTASHGNPPATGHPQHHGVLPGQ